MQGLRNEENGHRSVIVLVIVLRCPSEWRFHFLNPVIHSQAHTLKGWPRHRLVKMGLAGAHMYGRLARMRVKGRSGC